MPVQSGGSIVSLTQAQVRGCRLIRFKLIGSNAEQLEIPLQVEPCQSHACLINRRFSDTLEEYEQSYDNLAKGYYLGMKSSLEEIFDPQNCKNKC